MIDKEEVIKKIRFITDKHAQAALFRYSGNYKVLIADRTIDSLIRKGFDLVGIYSNEAKDSDIIEDINFSFI